MLYTAIALFALAAVLGIILIRHLAIPQKPPRAAVYLHGLLAASGLIILIIYAIQYSNNRLTVPIVFFVIAALGGFTLFFRDLKGKLGPVWLAILHALVAVCGFLILLFQVI